ncbi:MAG: 50S ribosomal protein L22 [Actinomycetota bacterium]
MAGPKTNERPGTRAKVTYVRTSAYKAREVLNLIRGKSYGEAAEILEFSERGVSEDILKVLDSAVANAEHNDNQVAEELYVSACYADEGPTLKRWRPRARGRATRIRKRTCHITVIVSRYDDEMLERIRNREAATGRSGSSQAAEARRARVAQSKARQAEDDVEVDDDDVSVEDQADEIVTATAAEMEAAGDDYDAEKADSDQDSVVDADDESPFGPLSHAPLDDPQEMPEGYPIKGNADSMKFHRPDGRWYEQTVAEVWFATAEAAQEAGFVEAGKSAPAAGDTDAEEEE